MGRLPGARKKLIGVNTMSNSQENRFVGPVIKNSEVGDAVLEAIREDNKDRKIEVEEHASYFRIKVEKSVLFDLLRSRRCLEERLLGPTLRPTCRRWRGLFV